MNYRKRQLNDKTKEHISCSAKSSEILSTLSSLLHTAPTAHILHFYHGEGAAFQNARL